MSGLSIETVCLGVRFRSRLEARWAIFFNQMGISWEYEPERIQLETKVAVPDFFLPSLGVWFEVKPLQGGGRRESMWPDAKGVVAKTLWPFVLVEGSPSKHRMNVISRVGFGGKVKGVGLFEHAVWCSDGIETNIRIGCQAPPTVVFYGPKGPAESVILKSAAKSLPPNFHQSVIESRHAKFE